MQSTGLFQVKDFSYNERDEESADMLTGLISYQNSLDIKIDMF